MKPGLAIDHSAPALTGYHAPTLAGQGWDDAGERILTTAPAVDGDDQSADEERSTMAEGVCRFIARLIEDDASGEEVGEQVLVLAYGFFLHGREIPGGPHTQAELASRLGKSQGYVSKLLARGISKHGGSIGFFD